VSFEYGKSVYATSDPLTKTLNGSFINAFEMQILQKPTVPFSPDTSKLIAVPLNLKLDIVELLMV